MGILRNQLVVVALGIMLPLLQSSVELALTKPFVAAVPELHSQIAASLKINGRLSIVKLEFATSMLPDGSFLYAVQNKGEQPFYIEINGVLDRWQPYKVFPKVFEQSDWKPEPKEATAGRHVFLVPTGPALKLVIPSLQVKGPPQESQAELVLYADTRTPPVVIGSVSVYLPPAR